MFTSPTVSSWLHDCSSCCSSGVKKALEEMAKDFSWCLITAFEQMITFVWKEMVKSSSLAVLALTLFCRLIGVLTKKRSFLWMQEVASNKVYKISQKNGHKKVKTLLSHSCLILFQAVHFSTHLKYSGLSNNIGRLLSSWRGSVHHPLAAAAKGISVTIFQNCTVFLWLFVADVRSPMKCFSPLQKRQTSVLFFFLISLAFFSLCRTNYSHNSLKGFAQTFQTDLTGSPAELF